MFKRSSNIFLLIAGMIFIFNDCALAQLDRSQFSQYMLNQLVYNPSYAGSDDYFEATAVHRSQYVNQSNRMFATQSFSVHMPVYQLRSGIGLHVANDLIGVQRSTFVMADYAYKIKLSKGQLSLGTSVGLIQSSLDGTKLRAPDGEYTNDFGITHNDDFLPETFESGMTFDVGVGAYYKYKNLFAGVSATHLPISKVKLATEAGSTYLVYERTYYALAGYKFKLGKSFSMQPSVLVKSDVDKTQIDINNIFYYKHNIWLGLTLRGYDKRSFDAGGGILGFQLSKNFSVSYSYDVSTSFISNSNNGSHEILIGYRFKMKSPSRKGAVIYNPRFL